MEAAANKLLASLYKALTCSIVDSSIYIGYIDVLFTDFSKLVVTLLQAGAYEPLKAVNEHETEFHDNPNYITAFEIILRHTKMVM